jgi:hypothetical protein
MKEATGFGLTLKRCGHGTHFAIRDGREDGRDQTAATAAAIDAFVAIPEFQWNGHRAGRAGDGARCHFVSRHYLE